MPPRPQSVMSHSSVRILVAAVLGMRLDSAASFMLRVPVEAGIFVSLTGGRHSQSIFSLMARSPLTTVQRKGLSNVSPLGFSVASSEVSSTFEISVKRIKKDE